MRLVVRVTLLHELAERKHAVITLDRGGNQSVSLGGTVLESKLLCGVEWMLTVGKQRRLVRFLCNCHIGYGTIIDSPQEEKTISSHQILQYRAVNWLTNASPPYLNNSRQMPSEPPALNRLSDVKLTLCSR